MFFSCQCTLSSLNPAHPSRFPFFPPFFLVFAETTCVLCLKWRLGLRPATASWAASAPALLPVARLARLRLLQLLRRLLHLRLPLAKSTTPSARKHLRLLLPPLLSPLLPLLPLQRQPLPPRHRLLQRLLAAARHRLLVSGRLAHLQLQRRLAAAPARAQAPKRAWQLGRRRSPLAGQRPPQHQRAAPRPAPRPAPLQHWVHRHVPLLRPCLGQPLLAALALLCRPRRPPRALACQR